jgi:response regulator RpfG family c-di-GMP phosphodiesterase
LVAPIIPEQFSEKDVTVLFVDDEKQVLSALKRVFAEEPFLCAYVDSPQAALDICRTNANIGVVVSDLKMPEINGIELLTEVRNSAPDIIRIILTGFNDPELLKGAINEAGVTRYINKPFSRPMLISIVKDAVHQFSTLQENKRLHSAIKEKNTELGEWNQRLKSKLFEQIREISKKNKELKARTKEIKINYEDTIAALCDLTSLRSEFEQNHLKNVAELASLMAKESHLSPEEIEIIEIAARLHDLGKIGMPDSVLNKEFHSLNRLELEEFQRHPVRGQAVIDSNLGLREAGILIRHHHERYNGSGFPDNLRGEFIPLGARIIAIADFVDRTWQTELKNDLNAVLKRFRGFLGTRFDPELYPLLEKCLPKCRFLQKIHSCEILLVEDLRQGMIVGENIFSGTGVFLLKQNFILDRATIDHLNRIHEIDPFLEGVSISTSSLVP